MFELVSSMFHLKIEVRKSLVVISQVFFFSHTVLSGKLPVDVVNYQFALCLYRTHKELLFSVQGKLVTLN